LSQKYSLTSHYEELKRYTVLSPFVLTYLFLNKKNRFIRRRASPNGDYIRVSDTGIIQLPKPLDREFSSSYNITVAAQEILEDGKCYPLPYLKEISVQLYSRSVAYQNGKALTGQPVSTMLRKKGMLAGFAQQSSKSTEYLQIGQIQF